MADDVVIRLSGDAGALIAALRQSSEQFEALRLIMATTADAAKVFGQSFAAQADAWLRSSDGADMFKAKLQNLNEQMALTREQQDLSTQTIRDYTQQLSLTRETMTTLDEAQRVMGDGFANQSRQWLNAATSADDYAARLAYVREQLALTQEQTSIANSGLTGLSSFFTGFNGGGGGLGGLVSGFESAGLIGGEVAGPLGALAGGIDGVVNSIGQFVSQSVSFVAAMAAWTVIQDAVSWVQQLGDELFNLNVQTQRMDTGWRYLFGGPQHGGTQAAKDMMSWTSQFSMGIPFTRQDLMTAVTTLASRQYTPAQIEQFMPYLSDLTATFGSAAQGGRGSDLRVASQAIIRAQEGISRMIKTDLNIDPQELIPYGLKMDSRGKITDPNSLIRALEAFAKAKGVAGASGDIVNSTWWGAYSSATDKVQNLLLEMGGTQLNGDVAKGSFFDNLRLGLVHLMDWWDAHQGQLSHFADIVARLLGDVVSAGGGMLGQLAHWFDKLGGVGAIENGILGMDATIRQWFGLDGAPPDPSKIKSGPGGRQKYAQEIVAQSQTQGPPEWFRQMADAAQKIASLSWDAIMRFIQTMAKDGPSIAMAFNDIAQNFNNIAHSMTPQEIKALEDIMKIFGYAASGAAFVGLGDIDAMLMSIHGVMLLLAPVASAVATAFEDIARALQHMPQSLPSWLTGAFGWMGGGQGHSGHQSQVTHTPGGFAGFGQLGA